MINTVVNTLAEKKISDFQVFEFSDILSLPVDKSTYGNSHVGDVVKVGDQYGILHSEIAPTAEELKTLTSAVNFDPRSLNTFGLNVTPGYASVRIHGGVYKFKVSHSGPAAVGAAVYAKNTVTGGVTELTTDSAGGTKIGFLYNALTGTGPSSVVPVVFTA